MTTSAPGIRPVDKTSVPNQDLVARATALVELVRANADASDRERRVPEEVIQRMTADGLFQVAVPRRYGGWQSNIRTIFDITSEMARGDGGTGWVSALCNSNAWCVATYPTKAQDDVWGSDPQARVTTVLNPDPTGVATRVDGGYLINRSKWPYASASLHAQWGLFGFLVEEDGKPVHRMGLIPMSELSIEDTWFTVGMRGSGSNTVVAKDVFVPAYRSQTVENISEGRFATERTEEVEYRAPFIPFFALILAAPLVGLAQSALELTLQKAPSRKVVYTYYERGSDAPSVRVGVAEAANQIDLAVLLAHRACFDIDNAAVSGNGIDDVLRTRIRMDTGVIVSLCLDAVDKIMTVGGAGSFASANPLQRIWRDIETASRHALINPTIAKELYGQTLLGNNDFVAPV